MAKMFNGVRVRLLKKTEREEPENYAWCVEEYVRDGRKVVFKRILSRQVSQESAAFAMAQLLYGYEGGEA